MKNIMCKLHNMGWRNGLACALSIVALLCLVPGVLLSMLTINTQGAVNVPMAEFGIQFFDTSNSILRTVVDLANLGYYFVAIAIFVFSIVIPVTKSVLFAYMVVVPEVQERTQRFLGHIGKWSMSDVFIVSIFLAYLSTGSKAGPETHQTSVLGIPIDINVKLNMTAHLDMGFYCFFAYCLLSLIALQLFKRP